jgi:hypothetical protein
MPANPLDRLGELVMIRVRDKAIADWDKILDGRMRGVTAERVRGEWEAAGCNHTEAIRQLIPRIVDTTLHHLMWMLEQERSVELSIEVEGAVTRNLREASDGLSGELYGERGWIARFSKERHDDA